MYINCSMNSLDMRGKMNIIKKIIYAIFGDDIGKKIKRVVGYYRSRKKKVNTNVELKTIVEGFHTSCGYYDFDPVENGVLLLVTTDKKHEKTDVIEYDLFARTSKKTGKGEVVNWQQGNRLMWIGKGTYIYNSFSDDQYISIEHFEKNNIIHKWPVYDVYGNMAVSLDFNRLGWMRPGYGYTNFPLTEINETDCAIRLFDLSNDKEIAVITYAELKEALGVSVDLHNCYVNHLKFSPSGNRFMFFFIEIKNGRHMCYLSVYDNGNVNILDKELCASHYTWKNDNEILVTSYDDKHECGYYLYNVNNEDRILVLEKQLKKDGHPTYISEDCFITDTYPDSAGFQRILHVDLKNETIKELVAIYSTAKHVGVERCDLHPRVSKKNNSVYFDADIDGRRRVYEFELESIK